MLTRFRISKLKAIGVAVALNGINATMLVASSGCDKPSSSLAFASNGVASATLSPIDSYRLESVRRDPLLRETWGIFRSCSHPELPRRILRLSSSESLPYSLTAPVPMVYSGDILQLRNGEEKVNMQLVGVAEETGVVGQKIRVHLLVPMHARPAATRIDGSWGSKLFAVVLGPHEAEVRP